MDGASFTSFADGPTVLHTTRLLRVELVATLLTVDKVRLSCVHRGALKSGGLLFVDEAVKGVLGGHHWDLVLSVIVTVLAESFLGGVYN